LIPFPTYITKAALRRVFVEENGRQPSELEELQMEKVIFLDIMVALGKKIQEIGDYTLPKMRSYEIAELAQFLEQTRKIVERLNEE
jgi:hypothetical protein